MANLVITAANVAPVNSNPAVAIGQAGAAMTAGQVAYRNPTDSKWYPADCTTATKAGGSNTQLGVVLTTVAINQTATIFLPGQSIVIGATLTKGVTYVLSATANGGNICPASDLVSTNYYTVLGYASDTATLLFTQNSTGIQI